MINGEARAPSADPAVDRLRQARESPAVLKIKLSNIRARDKVNPVFIFEGGDDVGAYHSWVGRIQSGLRYEPVTATGKGQILEFRALLLKDLNDLARGVYFFIDRDFDDLRGHPPGEDLFCTDKYSIENYLISESVLREILNDEFRLAGDIQVRESAIAAFKAALEQFVAAMAEPNKRIFSACRLKVRIRKKEERIQRYVSVELSRVQMAHTAADLLQLIQLDRELTDAEHRGLTVEFSDLKPEPDRHRGKFLLAFFLKWLEAAAVERKMGTIGLFGSAVDVGFTTATLTARSLAARSPIPDQLPSFIERVARLPAAA